MSQPANRRTFTKAAVAGAGLAAWGVPAALQGAPSERVRVGVIGTANRGCQDIKAFLEQPDCEIVALCDVYQPHLAAANKLIGGKAAEYADFRKLLEHKGLDAVLVATPDHWHAIQTVNACDAGKDVYVEKPLSITVVEGRKMVEAARRNNRVVQVGTHRRSSTLYAQLAQLASEGKVGKITVARAYRASNMYPDGMGRAQPSAPPAELNWDM
ncbi:MAG: Gfo/Idh/MocA family protein, partial [Planctomycetota bacterium]